jgi:tetratricopeptide (TPR) repeat protein
VRGLAFVLLAVAGGLAGGLIGGKLSDDGQPAAREARRGGETALAGRLEDLERRLERMEQRVEQAKPAAAEGPAVEAPDTVRTGGETGAQPTVAGPDGQEKATSRSAQDLVASLKGKEYGYDAMEALYGWAFANKEKIDDGIRELEKQIKEDPTNADLRAALGTMHSTKFALNIVKGAVEEQQVWASASAAYNKAIELDPNHWQARYEKALGISMAPEFLGMKPVAIKQFEELRTIQESQPAADHHVHVYFRLGTLYKDMGNTEKALELWNDGLRRFPDSQALKGAVEASTKR